jgi:hypothetical protein
MDKWETMSIEGAPRLAAFSWTLISDSSIAILGGTNGSIMSEELTIIDLKSKQAEQKGASYPFFTGMGHLIFRKEENTLYHMGGLNSQGINYKIKLDQNEWQQCKQTHSIAANASCLELINNVSVYSERVQIQLI